jgi:nitroreductase
MTPLVEGLYLRRSVRAFSRELVTQTALTALIDAAVQAPSAMNEQPWTFIVVTDKTVLSSISKKAKAHALEEFAEESHIDHLRQTLTDPKFDIFYGAPALVVICAPKQSRWAIEDCAMAAENLMLAASAMTLGTCWIGFAQKWLNTDEGRSAIGLADTHLAVAPLIVGHPQGKLGSVPRRKPTIHWIT